MILRWIGGPNAALDRWLRSALLQGNHVAPRHSGGMAINDRVDSRRGRGTQQVCNDRRAGGVAKAFALAWREAVGVPGCAALADQPWLVPKEPPVRLLMLLAGTFREVSSACWRRLHEAEIKTCFWRQI
jgi:hypothetical protein